MNTLDKIKNEYERFGGGLDYYLYFNGKPLKYKSHHLIMMEVSDSRNETDRSFGYYKQSKERRGYTKETVSDVDLVEVKNKLESLVLESNIGEEVRYDFTKTAGKLGWNDIIVYIDPTFNIIFIESVLYNAVSKHLNENLVDGKGARFIIPDDNGVIDSEEGYKRFIVWSRAERYLNYMEFIESKRVRRQLNSYSFRFYKLLREFSVVSLRSKTPVSTGRIFNPIFDDKTFLERFVVSPNVREYCMLRPQDFDMGDKVFERETAGKGILGYLKEEDYKDYKVMFLTGVEVSKLLDFDWKLPLSNKVATALIMSHFVEEPSDLAPSVFASFNKMTYVTNANGQMFGFTPVIDSYQFNALSPEEKSYYSVYSRAQRLILDEEQMLMHETDNVRAIATKMKDHRIGGIL